MEDIIENLKGHSFYFVADLKSGYDAVPLKDKSQDLTAFHVYDLGLMCLTLLPQGYTNSMIEFCRRTSHMLRSMKPEHADSFVDNLFGMGPPTRYMDKLIPKNPNIRQFIYEGESGFPYKETEEPHKHYIVKNDTEEYWDKILAYLHLIRCRWEILRIRKLMKLRIFDIEANRNQ